MPRVLFLVLLPAAAAAAAYQLPAVGRDGTVRPFEKPWFMVLLMFLGEHCFEHKGISISWFSEDEVVGLLLSQGHYAVMVLCLLHCELLYLVLLHRDMLYLVLLHCEPLYLVLLHYEPLHMVLYKPKVSFCPCRNGHEPSAVAVPGPGPNESPARESVGGRAAGTAGRAASASAAGAAAADAATAV